MGKYLAHHKCENEWNKGLFAYIPISATIFGLDDWKVQHHVTDKMLNILTKRNIVHFLILITYQVIEKIWLPSPYLGFNKTGIVQTKGTTCACRKYKTELISLVYSIPATALHLGYVLVLPIHSSYVWKYILFSEHCHIYT
jgi:hypothetical protein